MNIARKPPCRLEFVFAAKSPVTVILRRGPSRWVRMVVWHTNNDHFVDGEWWHGRIYADKCGLSPNGELFVYFGYQWKERYLPKGIFAFTAVSKPPDFKPLALWPAGSFWGGGGCFLTNRAVALHYGNGCLPEAHPSFPPHGLEIKESAGRGIYQPPDEGFRLNPAEHAGAEWLGKDPYGRRVFTRSGVLYRLIKNQEAPLRDFNADLPPPLAIRASSSSQDSRPKQR